MNYTMRTLVRIYLSPHTLSRSDTLMIVTWLWRKQKEECQNGLI